MEYGKIIAVTGLPGLFELLNSKNDGAIVRSLEDKSTKFVSSRVHNFSHLESIEVFTVRENVNLTEVFHAIENEGGKIPDGKDAAALKQYFQKVYPDLDFERVYSSDLKKMVKWYEVLKKNNIEIKLSEQPQEEEAEEAPVVEEVKETSKKKAADAKTKAADAKTVTAEPTEDKPKKAAAKKKAEPTDEAKEEKAPAKKAAAKKAAPKKK